MKQQREQAKSILEQKGIKVSLQRVAILDYLLSNLGHPTCEQIYHDLQQEVRVLSRATVYNTLHLFEEKGLVLSLNIDEGLVRYDVTVDEHGHFQCRECGEIFNFQLRDTPYVHSDLAGFDIASKSVYFRGTCPQCLAEQNRSKESKGETHGKHN